MKKKLLIIISILTLLSGCSKQKAKPVIQTTPLVGAYYYLWYPKNFSLGLLRKELRPMQKPLLGWYNSNDKKIIEQHIDWCKKYGINFLALSWWPGEKAQNSIIKDSFLKSSNINDIKFCIFYETWRLGFDRASGTTNFSDKTIDDFLSDMKEIQKNYFSHPSYLKVNNSPVLILYLTRTFAGKYKKAITQLRKQFKEQGHDIFIIGDEIFWDVIPASKTIFNRSLFKTKTPQLKRIKLFDAITSYNLYESGIPSHYGYAKDSDFFHDAKILLNKYRNICKNDVYFVPGIFPGYNDRGVRPRENHFAIPRTFSKDSGEGSFFQEYFNQLVKPFIDPGLNIFLITSFNEWNEDTQIEPTKKAPATSKSKGTPENYFTENYSYPGYELTYLETLKKIRLSSKNIK